MMKQTIFTILVVSLISTFVYSSPLFTFSKLFESVNNKRLDSTICCLPSVFSLKETVNAVGIGNNNQLQNEETQLNYYVDYKTGKIRQDMISYFSNGSNNTRINWMFKVGQSVTVSYFLSNAKCECQVQKQTGEWWNPVCVPNTSDISISKIKVGAYDGLKISIGNTGNIMTFREPQMTSDKCWVLNYFFNQPNVAQDQFFYDMVEKVDQNVFLIPSQCPSINSCLNQ